MSPALSSRAFDRHHAQALAAALSLLALALVLYHSLAGGTLLSPNVYDSYLLQAKNWLEGRAYIEGGENYPWLELAVFEGRYYLSFPPAPSVLALLPAALGLSLGNLWQALWALAALAGVYLCFWRGGPRPPGLRLLGSLRHLVRRTFSGWRAAAACGSRPRCSTSPLLSGACSSG